MPDPQDEGAPAMNENDERLLGDLLDGRLDDEGTALLRRRIAEEPPLQETWDELRRLRALLRADDGLRAPPDFLDRVRRRLGEARGAPPAARSPRGAARAPLALVPWIGAAAALVLVGFVLGRSGEREPPDAVQVVAKEAPTGGALARIRSRGARPQPGHLLVLEAPSQAEGEAALDRLLAGEARGALSLRTAVLREDRIVGTVLRRVTPDQLERLRLAATPDDDAKDGEEQETADVETSVTVKVVICRPRLEGEGDQGDAEDAEDD